MKIFKIMDEDAKRSVGCLLNFEKEGSFIIELRDDLDEWSAPLLFAGLVKKKNFTVPRDESLMWVKERIIPSGRQNISSILSHHKLKAYDEGRFLEISEGRCSQDHLYIKKVEKLPGYVKRRQQKNLVDCVMCEGFKILCFFVDGTVKKVNLRKIKYEGTDKISANKSLYESGKIAAGGYCVTFNESIDIPAYMLYQQEEISIKSEDFLLFVKKNILDTSDCCNALECTRQNISYMVKQQQLIPLKEDVKGNLYLKGDILKQKW